MSVFVILFLALLIWCWYTKYEDINREYVVIWVAFAGYSCFFLGATTLPYWAVVYSPFVALLILLYPERTKILIWLETAAGAAYFIMGLCNYGYAYAASANIRWMLAGILNGREIRGVDFSRLFDNLSEGAGQNIEALLTGVFITTIAAMLIITWPGRKKQHKDEMEIDKGSVFARFALNSFFALLPLMAYFII